MCRCSGDALGRFDEQFVDEVARCQRDVDELIGVVVIATTSHVHQSLCLRVTSERTQPRQTTQSSDTWPHRRYYTQPASTVIRTRGRTAATTHSQRLQSSGHLAAPPLLHTASVYSHQTRGRTAATTHSKRLQSSDTWPHRHYYTQSSDANRMNQECYKNEFWSLVSGITSHWECQTRSTSLECV